jgi:hypothetical protein
MSNVPRYGSSRQRPRECNCLRIGADCGGVCHAGGTGRMPFSWRAELACRRRLDGGHSGLAARIGVWLVRRHTAYSEEWLSTE